MNKRLIVKKHGKPIPDLTLVIPSNGIVSVGSDASATIELKDETIAPEQFVVVCDGDLLTLLCRVENTRINENLLPKGSLHTLEAGDQIVVGDYSLFLENGGKAEKIPSGEMGEQTAMQPAIELPPAEAIAPEQLPPAANIPALQTPPFLPDKSLSDVLENLKGEEKFYFLIENDTGDKRRVYVETDELWLGWSPTGECAISANPAHIALPRAQIRKDWSGVILYPLKNKNVWLNEQALDEPRRLKNDDSLQLLSREKALPDPRTTIRFHEPTALLVLDSILPRELPPPISLEKKRPPQTSDDRSAGKSTITKRKAAAPPDDGRILGYFTGLEILIMIIGILVAASLIFLVLEYF